MIHYTRRVPDHCGNWTNTAIFSGLLLDQVTDVAHLVGTLQWADGGSNKAIDSIAVYCSAASAPVGTLRCSIQETRAASGSLARGGTGTAIIASTIAPPAGPQVMSFSFGNVGSFSTGRELAVVVDWATYTSGSVSVGVFSTPQVANDPATSINTSTSTAVPLVLFKASDGTYGTFRGASFLPAAPSAVSFADATSPNEVGNVFRAPYDCTVSGVWFHAAPANRTTSTVTAYLYADPAGSPVELGAAVGDATNLWSSPSAGGNIGQLWFPSPVALTGGVDYAVSLYGTGSTNVNLSVTDLGTAAIAAALEGGTQVYEVNRLNRTGSFATTTPSRFVHMGVIISGVSSSGGGATIRSQLNPGLN